MAITKTIPIEALAAGVNTVLSGSGDREFTIIDWILASPGIDMSIKFQDLDGSATEVNKTGLINVPSGSSISGGSKIKFGAGSTVQLVVSGTDSIGGIIEYSAKGSS